MPLAIEDVRVPVVGVGVDQCKSVVSLTPRLDMWEEMDLRLLGHPGGLPERCDKLAGAGNELNGITDAETTVVAIPPGRHRRTLHHGLAWTSAKPRGALAAQARRGRRARRTSRHARHRAREERLGHAVDLVLDRLGTGEPATADEEARA